MKLARKEFEEAVVSALKGLPPFFKKKMENIDVVVADRPTRRQVGRGREARGETLLGLYEGVPLTERTETYGMVVPDKITIFQQPIESIYRSDTQIIAGIQRVVRHEIAHHFGISDHRLNELGMG